MMLGQPTLLIQGAQGGTAAEESHIQRIVYTSFPSPDASPHCEPRTAGALPLRQSRYLLGHNFRVYLLAPLPSVLRKFFLVDPPGDEKAIHTCPMRPGDIVLERIPNVAYPKTS